MEGLSQFGVEELRKRVICEFTCLTYLDIPWFIYLLQHVYNLFSSYTIKYVLYLM
jgi:hypothetical protein